MNDDMTVRTNRTQIIYGINSIHFTDVRKRLQMMDMNNASPNLTIRFFKIKATNDTPGSIVFYASVSRTSISLITIDIYLFFCAFIENFVAIKIYFFWNCYF
ncbi:MAG: hypothetical protein AUI36_36350 [Cyanobacteria bacterium 13_1_40CM_2_61_4]|nr:MAG: hypothetical protein AUI36_36350 [Cyanobacteria bacterium 13_1_40CM_2_61_4]